MKTTTRHSLTGYLRAASATSSKGQAIQGPASSGQQKMQVIAATASRATPRIPQEAMQRKATGSRPAKGMQRLVVQRAIGDYDNVVFGLDGRTEAQIGLAIKTGYRTFDGAASYKADGDRNTVDNFANAVKSSGLKADEFELIYKVDGSIKADALGEHLKDIAKKLDNPIDHVLIHKLADIQRPEDYIEAFKKLKEERTVKNIGIGDIKHDSKEEYFKLADSFEIDAMSLVGANADSLIKKLKDSEKLVFIYNIIGLFKQLMGDEEAADITKYKLQAMNAYISKKLPSAEPILSSSNEKRMDSNILARAYDEKYGNEVAPYIAKIEGAVSLMHSEDKEIPLLSSAESGFKERIARVLTMRADWTAQELFKDEDERKKLYNEARDMFSPAELNRHFKGGSGVPYTLSAELAKLFDSTTSCPIAAAYTKLSTDIF